ncbi:unnamed protein product [Brassica oleracea]
MDCKVKIWDVYNSGKCMRIYMGHGKAVRDICFSNDGTKFLTGGYDKNIKYWDTETGHRLSRQEGSLCGEVTQEYDQHLGAVNTITFVNNDSRSCKEVFRTLKCHNGVCTGAEWHPLEQSKVATCGWDGLIKYWIERRESTSDGSISTYGDMIKSEQRLELAVSVTLRAAPVFLRAMA